MRRTFLRPAPKKLVGHIQRLENFGMSAGKIGRHGISAMVPVMGKPVNDPGHHQGKVFVVWKSGQIRSRGDAFELGNNYANEVHNVEQTKPIERSSHENFGPFTSFLRRFLDEFDLMLPAAAPRVLRKHPQNKNAEVWGIGNETFLQRFFDYVPVFFDLNIEGDAEVTLMGYSRFSQEMQKWAI